MNKRAFAVAGLCLFIAVTLAAQAAPPSQAPAPVFPRVVKATGYGPGGTAGLGHRLVVDIENFPALLEKSGGCEGIVLFINDLPMAGVKPVSCDETSGRVHFILDRDPTNEKNDMVWHTLLGSPTSYVRDAMVSVGPNDSTVYPSGKTFRLFIIPRAMLFVFFIFFAVTLAIFIHLCRKTSIIRSPVVAPTGALPPYSLSRFQMAFWFFLVIAGYVFMWLITGELDTISESILALIGIGAGTALGAALIDAPPGAGQPAPPPSPSKGFLHDMLTDDNGGVSFHRFQMFAWTVILGIIFITSVYKQLAMPQFSATLLGLMGISSGTYLGFKFPEKRNDQLIASGELPPQQPPETK
jgi:hypothetical protein